MDQSADRLDSWKEIANHFRRTVRTVQRWEHACGLPVHRHGHALSSSVYAFRTEIEAWWLNRERPEPATGRDGTESERRPAARRQSIDASVDDLLEMARVAWNTRTFEGIRRSVALAQRASEREPHCGPAHAMEALAQSVLASYVVVPATEAMEAGRRAAERALELDDSLADAHAALGLIRMGYDYQWAKARQSFQRAVELRPHDATAWSWFGFWHLAVGNHAEALRDTRRAEQLDPSSLIIKTQLGWVLHFLGRYAEALDQLEETLAREPAFWRAYLNSGFIYIATGQHDNAVRALETGIALNDYPVMPLLMARAHALAGRPAEAVRLVETAGRDGRHQSPYFLGQAWLALGYIDRAAQLLRQAYDEREWLMIFLRLDPGLDQLRDHPTYREVVTAMAFEV